MFLLFSGIFHLLEIYFIGIVFSCEYHLIPTIVDGFLLVPVVRRLKMDSAIIFFAKVGLKALGGGGDVCVCV